MSLKFGIIGYGGIGEWHSRHIPRVDGLEVIAVHDINVDKIAEAKANGFRAYAKLASFLNDPDVEAVLVATPNDYHMELAMASAAAGKHVIVEKPAALNLSQLDNMIATAKKHNVVFSVHQNRRWDPDYRIARQAVEENRIGKVHMIQSRVHGPNGYLHGWRRFKEQGGGMMYDWGVHLLDQILWWIPTPVKQVQCHFRSVLNPEVDDYFLCTIEFTDGLLALIEVGTLCLRPLPRWYVLGSTGSVRVEGFGGNEGGITVLTEGPKVSKRRLEDTVAGPTRTFSPDAQAKHLDQSLPNIELDGLTFYRNFAAAVDGKEQLIVTPAQVRRVLSVMEAAFASGETGMPVAPTVPV
jgi:predicted dehydrogenase